MCCGRLSATTSILSSVTDKLSSSYILFAKVDYSCRSTLNKYYKKVLIKYVQCTMNYFTLLTDKQG